MKYNQFIQTGILLTCNRIYGKFKMIFYKSKYERTCVVVKYNKLIEKLHPQNRMQLFWLYTVLFVITLILSFFPFYILNVSMLRIDTDGFYQHYETLIYLKRAIKQLFENGSFSFWSWNIGLGADTIGSLGYVFFNPFNYIAALFPEKYLTWGYTIEIYLELYTAGVGFLYFGKITNMSHKHSLWGAFAFVFSSWVSAAASMHTFFVLAAISFVFIMAGVVKVLHNQSPAVLIIMMTFSAISNLYFSYMTALIIFFYLLTHFIITEKKTIRNCIHYWGQFILYLVIATCLAAIFLMPTIYTLMNAAKDSATNYSLFHSFSSYIHFCSFLLGGQQMFGQYSLLRVTPIFLILLPCIIHFILKKKATPAMLVFTLCLIFLLFPFFNSMLNGFSYPTARWCYAATFFYIWSGIQILSAKDFNIQHYKKIIYIMLLFSEFMLIIVGRIILMIASEIIVINSIINLIFAFCFYHFLEKKQKKKQMRSVLITFAIMVNTIILGFTQNVPGISSNMFLFSRHGEINSKFEYATQRAGIEIKDDSFYRIDQIDYLSPGRLTNTQYPNTSYRPTHIPANETLVFNTRSIYTYLSSTDGRLFDFYKYLGNNASYSNRIYTYGNDNRTRLDFLMGVKYFLGNNPRNNPPTGANEYSSYGFSLKGKSSRGVEILKNKYSIGIGCTFDSYITESEWMQLDYPDREQALMQHIILPDDEETTLAHANSQSISSGFLKTIYHISDSSNILSNGIPLEDAKKDFHKAGNISLTQGNGNFSIHLDKKYNNCELYFIARNLKRNIESTNTIRYSREKIGNLRRIRSLLNTGKNFGDYGGFTISVSMGRINKKAVNTLGSVNGFSDIRDFMVNLGEYNENAENITVSLDTVGDYSYDSIEILAVPLSTYEGSAKSCISKSYNISEFSDNYVRGTIDTFKNSSMLYLSIPYHAGWKAFVDGREVSTQLINTSFLGIPINSAGRHTIELRYRPIGYKIGIISLIIGILSFIAACCFWHKHNRKGECK